MKRNDLVFIIVVILFLLPFFLIGEVYSVYVNFNASHGMIMSFIKFVLLATLGEVIAFRIRKGAYYEKGFGILPRAVVWGFLGLTIKAAFVIFSTGTPVFAEYLGMNGAVSVMKGDLNWLKVLVAFCISTAMNITYAPVMMTFHKITDTHIQQTGGTLRGLFSPIPFAQIFGKINWDVQWNFVFKKTIPLFWIPAHTITFLLPADFQVLFAALLSVALGLLLAIAGMKPVSKTA
jgi:hypothetical protein